MVNGDHIVMNAVHIVMRAQVLTLMWEQWVGGWGGLSGSWGFHTQTGSIRRSNKVDICLKSCLISVAETAAWFMMPDCFALWMAMSVWWSTTEISQKRPDGLPLKFVHSWSPWILMSLVTLWLFLQRQNQVDICDFDWNVSIAIAMKYGTNNRVPSGWILITLAIPGQNFNPSSTLVCDQIIAKLIPTSLSCTLCFIVINKY